MITFEVRAQNDVDNVGENEANELSVYIFIFQSTGNIELICLDLEQ